MAHRHTKSGRVLCTGTLLVLMLGITHPGTAIANDWISLHRAKPYQGLSPEQAQQRRRAQILLYLKQEELKAQRNTAQTEKPVPDSRFPESYRALADYYKSQGKQNRVEKK